MQETLAKDNKIKNSVGEYVGQNVNKEENEKNGKLESNRTEDDAQAGRSKYNRKIEFTKEKEEHRQKVPTHLVQKLRIIKNIATKQKLITRSHYDGVWQESLQCMDGYGTYTYPDRSEYRGYFRRGHFNGYGTLHLATPYNLSFKGTFIDGLLHEIEDMWFDDGLHVTASFDGWSADFSKWQYCCTTDRRYATEQIVGLPAVGPYSFLTSKIPARELGRYYFDLEEGFYNPSTGLIMQRPKPFTSISVPCKDHVDWIIKNCRRGSGVHQEPPNDVYHQIIRNNLENELDLAEHHPSCIYDQKIYRKRYFGNLCKHERMDRPDVKVSQDSVVCRLGDSSSTCTSLSGHSISIDIQEYLEMDRQYDKMKLGRDLERDQPTLISEPYQRNSARSSSILYGRKSK